MTRLFDARQYATLLAVGLRQELTGNRAAAAGELGTQGAGGPGAEIVRPGAAIAGPGAEIADGSRHLLSASYGLTFSTIVASLLFQSAEPAQFLLFTTTISMFFAATNMVGELASGLFHPLDLAVTGHLPVSGFTRFAARFTELAAMLAVLTLNLNLAPAILLGFMSGGNSAAAFVCLAAAFCAVLFTAGACLVAYGLLARILSARQFEGALLYANIAVSLAVLGLLLNLGPLMEQSAEAAAAGWPLYFPPAWFASLALAALGLPGGEGPAVFAALAGIAAAILPLAGAAHGSERLLRALAAGGRSGRIRSAPGPLMQAFARLCVRPEETAAFEFTAVQLARDHGFRLKAYPILGVPILIITMSFFEPEAPLFYIVMLHLMNLYLSLVLTFLPFSDHFPAAWVFDAVPAPRPQVFSAGAEKAFVFRIVLPLGVLNAAVLAAIWSPLEGAVHAAYAALAGLFVVGARFRRLQAYPFSREFRGVLAADFGGTLSAGLAILAAFAALQAWAQDRPAILAAAAAGMIYLHRLRFQLFWRRSPAKGAAA